MQGGQVIHAGGEEEQNSRRLELMSDLRRAIEHGELSLYCQPKIDMASRQVCGAEALVRWTRRVPTARSDNSTSGARRASRSPLSINLSAHDLRDPDLNSRVRELFAKWRVEPRMVQFKLTERAVMDDAAGALATLNALKEGGASLFIDDFGTGYSSLSYLQKLPLDGIKIDQSFIIPMIEDSDSAMIVHSTPRSRWPITSRWRWWPKASKASKCGTGRQAPDATSFRVVEPANADAAAAALARQMVGRGGRRDAGVK